jgi:ACS family tartrate transporter-like MFS transporter
VSERRVTPAEWPPGGDAMEARVTRKLQLRILPFAMLLYLVSFLDRLNVGFAALTMNKALGLTPAMYGLGGGLFFVGYVLVQVPSNLLLLRVGARAWIARVVIVWGIVSLCSAFVVGPWSFYAMRFLLGVAEAGFFPGMLLYLSLWFPARQRAVAIAVFMAAAPLSTAIGSPISGALMELPRMMGLANWQWLYILEALPAILLGFLTLGVLTDKLSQATWLDDDERAWLARTLAAEHAESEAIEGGIRATWSVVSEPRVLALAVVYSGTSAGLYALGFWAPLLIKQFGHSAHIVGWLNALPGVVAVVGMVLWARHSDKAVERVWHVAIPCLIGCAGLVWAGYAQATTAVILALAAASFGVNASKGPIWAVPSQFLSGQRAAAGFGLINSLGNLGGFIGPLLIGWIKSTWGSYVGGLNLVAGMMAFSAVLMVAIGKSFRQERKAASQRASETAG